MALISPARAESVRNCIRKLGLPSHINIFLFGFDTVKPEDEPFLPPSVASGESAADAPAPAATEAKRRGPKPGTVRISYEEIGKRLEEWCGKYAEFPAEVSLDRLAEETGLYRTHLLKYFQYHLGKDFRLWKLEQKISCAQHLLRERPGMLVTDIAIRTGFNNTANFFRQFKRITGVTPLEWRNEG